ncbi:MaoC family dehydratase [Chromobacterium sp. IIBBL 290-4]|uniref:MaoC family dehydratase n=1 Tax=Chromobacterium sp. IIBBL 290-4 TaxID=2953890 RepID=UPI0020B7DD44|nr:MaoC family dehydratase [Chromobacterium sp. IIBBL 290-4]UTH72271.1 MaoC family dehydratase [Chromobacterium sp. IIBBL 290-4]
MTVFFEDLAVGQTAEGGKTITEADILLFAAVSGDNNPVHLNQVYAATTPFETRIAHGMLTASLISGVIGTQLPGYGTVYLSQTTRFKAPVRIGETVTTRVTVEELFPEKKRVRLSTRCLVGEKVVLEGESLVIAPSRG